MTEPPDPTLDPDLRSWVPVPEGSEFPIQNLPYGVFRPGPGTAPRAGVAIGDHVLDLADAQAKGLLPRLPGGLFARPSLNGFMSLPRASWRAARERISALLAAGSRERGRLVLAPRAEVELLRPFDPGDYVDFYSSIEHASNMGRMFRPDDEPLLPNWRRLPVAYHGRASSIVASGTPIRRPRGQVAGPGGGPPEMRPTAELDIELEMGFVAGGPENPLGRPVPIGRAGERIFGMVLVNDWSARDVQRFEYRPLGPYLAKSFATSVSPWVVTLDALEPFRVAPPAQDPPPAPHLATAEPWAFDVELSIELSSGRMAKPIVVSRTNFRGMYWTVAQQLAHAASNGTNVRAGDLYASGTISGPDPGTYGSLIELTWRGTRPIELPDGTGRTFLLDGDTVVLRGRCPGSPGRVGIGFGEVRGTIEPQEAT